MNFLQSIPTHMSQENVWTAAYIILCCIQLGVFFRRAIFVILCNLTKNLKYRGNDFEGQARAEKWSRVIITLFGIAGLIWGYFTQQFSHTVYILTTGFLLSSILTIPPWPLYRRKPLNWQPARDASNDTTTAVPKEGSKKGKKNK